MAFKLPLSQPSPSLRSLGRRAARAPVLRARGVATVPFRLPAARNEPNVSCWLPTHSHSTHILILSMIAGLHQGFSRKGRGRKSAKADEVTTAAQESGIRRRQSALDLQHIATASARRTCHYLYQLP